MYISEQMLDILEAHLPKLRPGEVVHLPELGNMHAALTNTFHWTGYKRLYVIKVLEQHYDILMKD